MTLDRSEKGYASSHECLTLSPSRKTGTISLSPFATASLGDIVFVELPTTPLVVKAGDAIGAVESVKSASDIYSPVSGTIVEANALLEEKPGVLNKNTEGDGWIARIEFGDEGEEEEQEITKEEWEALMSEKDYGEFTKEG